MKKIIFGVMGCASIAKRSVIPAIIQSQKAELRYVASRSIEKANEFAKQFDVEALPNYEALLVQKDIDAIYMPLPTGLHYEWANKVLDAGKHLLIEKSLSTDYLQASDIIEKAKGKNLLVIENYMFEYHTQQKAVLDLVKSHLGKIRLFKASFGFPPLKYNNFRYDPDVGGGALIDAGGYVLKALRVFFPGYRYELLSSTLGMSETGVDLVGSGMFLLHRNECNTIPAHVAFGFDNFYQCGVEFWGSKGKIVTDRTFTAHPAYKPQITLETSDFKDRIELEEDNHFLKIIDHFATVLKSRRFSEEYDSILVQARLQQNFRTSAVLLK
tara:strand:+ start:22639 stop:23619 length:981 start_codon:yes stop_codon:yes gene_type:complete